MTTTASLMEAAVWTGPETIEIRKVPLPEVPEGWALVRVEYTGLCGTDFSILHGTHPRAQAPLIMGHEITGIVEQAAPDGPPAGSRVTVEPLISCGRCAACLSGNTHVCQDLKLFGIDSPGSLAAFVALPASSLIAVDAGVPPREVALAEPLAVAVHAVNRSGLRPGDTVMVFGAGPIGVLTALVAQNAGARVVVSEPSEERRLVAEGLGLATVPADSDPVRTMQEFTAGTGADIVFDTAAHPAVAASLTKAVRVQGTVMLVGVYKKPTEMDLQALTFAENTVLGVRVYTRSDVEAAVALLEKDALQLGRLPVSVYPLEHTAEAYDKAMSASRILKVLVRPGGWDDHR